MSLAEARELALQARAKVRRGIDPGQERQAAKAITKAAAVHTFAQVASRWLEVKERGWPAVTRRNNRRVVEVHLLPYLGALSVGAVKTSDVVPVIRDADLHSPEYARAAAGAAQGIIRLAIAGGAREEGRLLDLDLRHNLPRHEPLKIAKRRHEPPAWKAYLQTLLALGPIFAASRLFVNQLDLLGPQSGFEPPLPALLFSPIATELPGTMNAVIWVRQGKHRLALANINGSMMIQATVVCCRCRWRPSTWYSL